MILGLILLYFIGKSYYDLADTHNKSRWGFAIVGIVSFYAGIFVGGIILGIVLGIFWMEELETMNETLLGAMAIPFGALGCWGLYKILQRRWRNQVIPEAGDSLDSGLMQQNREDTTNPGSGSSSV